MKYSIILVVVGLALSAGCSGSLFPSADSNTPIKNKKTAEECLATVDDANKIARAWQSYEKAHQYLPAAYSATESGSRLLSWRVHILPHLGYEELYEKFNLNEPWDSPNNKKLISEIPPEFTNPFVKLANGKTSYLAVIGDRTIASAPKPDSEEPNAALGNPSGAIQDGTSYTFFLVETKARQAVVWTRPLDFEYQEFENPVSELKQIVGGVMLGGILGGHYTNIAAAEKDFQAAVEIDGHSVDFTWIMLSKTRY